jgi:hypothetical protein
MRRFLSIVLGAATLVGLSAGTGEVRAQGYSPTTRPGPTGYGVWAQRYYYYSPYDSGYYTVFSPGYRAYYAVPGSGPYYRPNLPRYYTPSTPAIPGPETSPGSPVTARTTTPSNPAIPGPETSPGESAFPPESPSASQPNGTEGVFPSPPKGEPINPETGNYPSSADYYIPPIYREGDPGAYWHYKASLERYYFNPRGYEVNKQDIDRQYFNHRSPQFFAPSYWSIYQFPGMSTFYTSSSMTSRK